MCSRPTNPYHQLLNPTPHPPETQPNKQVGIDLRNFSLFMHNPYESYCPCREAVAAREAAEAAEAARAEQGWVAGCIFIF